MAIDRSGKDWKGAGFTDLAEYLREYTEEGHPARIVMQPVCECGGTRFRLDADQTEGCARRTCADCGKHAFIADGEEYWDEADPEPCRCLCGGSLFELGVAFSLREDEEEVRWITVGERCVRCGTLGSFVDWEINYAPTDHLFGQV